MSKSRLWIVLSLVLVFAAGAAAGIFAERYWFVRRPPARSADRPTHEHWVKALGLTEEQRTKIREIFKKNDVRLTELRTDFDKHLGDIRSAMMKEINAVLTPEQKAKQDAMIKQYREARKKETERRTQNSGARPQGTPTKELNNEKETRHRSGDPGDRRGSHPGLFPF
jgi:Spy/CpxP family protein refolding chaperone